MEGKLSHEYVTLLPPVDQCQIDEFGHVSDVEFNVIGRKNALEWFRKCFGTYAKWCAPITKTKACSYVKPLVVGATHIKVKTGLVSWNPTTVGVIKTIVYDDQKTYYSETREVKVLVQSPALSLHGISKDIGFDLSSKL